ncbi:ABC transporter substrate-binding protein [Azorhizobium doebereinerae]|uniref:ABC transporter substrate-binding protein n=1 Tax=Azorhizobium doebereinerae TaxID=281091 RepID=UPI0003FB6898|nr:ABC transporter substrate-binding protein [Azorhizobium doebereinerae]
MRHVFRTLVLAGSLLAAASAHAETTLKFGAAQTSAGSLPLIVAQQKGLFAAEGIKMERIDFKGGAPAVQALAAGSIDVCICAADHAVRLTERGLGGKVLVALADQHSYAIMAPAGSKATSLKDLKGQKVGITSAGSLTDTTLRYAIRKIGLNPDTDFEIISIGTGGPMRAAVESGAVAAGLFSTPDIQANEARAGVYKIVEDFRKMPYAAQDLVVTDSWLKAHPQEAKAVASAVAKALKLIQSDRAVLRAAVVEMFPTFDPALVDKVTADVAAGYLSPDGKLNPESYKTLLEMMSAADPNMKKVPYDEIVALSYLPQ